MSEKPKISAIIPHWPVRPEVDDLLKRCVQALDVFEKIVVVNEGTGMGKAINKGLSLATGDYLLVTSNDCIFQFGDLNDMCDPKAITLPNNMPGQWDLPRCFFCLPRWVYEQVGGYDEQFEVGYFEDDDLIRRWRDASIQFVQIPSIIVSHSPGTTLDKMPNRQAIFDENQRRFKKKWGGL
jgi:glycosyltransferase involved in cell wall biosynthesis